MITFEEALKRVESQLEKIGNEKEGTVIKVLLEETIETKDYWVFFYNNSRFLETGDFNYSLIGNAPYIVDKYRGEIYITGTAEEIEFYIDEYEKNILPRLKGSV
jgi:hypothetical protein